MIPLRRMDEAVLFLLLFVLDIPQLWADTEAPKISTSLPFFSTEYTSDSKFDLFQTMHGRAV